MSDSKQDVCRNNKQESFEVRQNPIDSSVNGCYCKGNRPIRPLPQGTLNYDGYFYLGRPAKTSELGDDIRMVLDPI